MNLPDSNIPSDPSLNTEQDKYTEEERDIADRTAYLMELNVTLNAVNRVGEELKGEIERREKDFTQGEIGAAMFVLFNEVYGTLDDSKEFYGDEFRKIKGTHLWEIGGIDASAIGINTTIPKELGRVVGGVSVRLEDLDQVRLNELQSIANTVSGDPKKIKIVRDMISRMGGIQYDPLFKKKE